MSAAAPPPASRASPSPPHRARPEPAGPHTGAPPARPSSAPKASGRTPACAGAPRRARARAGYPCRARIPRGCARTPAARHASPCRAPPPRPVPEARPALPGVVLRVVALAREILDRHRGRGEVGQARNHAPRSASPGRDRAVGNHAVQFHPVSKLQVTGSLELMASWRHRFTCAPWRSQTVAFQLPVSS